LTHMSMKIMFLENVVGNLINIITIDWPIQVDVFFVQLFIGTIVLNVAKRKLQSYQNSNLSSESILSMVYWSVSLCAMKNLEHQVWCTQCLSSDW
jgi:hypothetical protein